MLATFEELKKNKQPQGTITKLLPGLVVFTGLTQVKVAEIVITENDVPCRIMRVGREEVLAMVLGNALSLHQGMQVVATGRPLEIAVDDSLLGFTLNSLGEIRDRRELSDKTEHRPVEIAPLGLPWRAPTTEPLDTGVALVDLMIPLAKGQRELIIGDKKTGKSTFAMQVLLKQAATGAICIYAGIGKRSAAWQSMQAAVAAAGVADRVVFVVSELGENAGQIFLTPYTAMTVAEYFRDQGQDVVVILDNLTTHAEYYRELALLAQEFPGKEAYPGDIFYIHARLMERAGSFQIDKKKVNLTCLPLAETTEGDLAGYIQTNLMSMTDGHLFFDHDILLAGRLPAVNLLLSVTRVGRQTQSSLEHQLSNKLLELVSDFQKAQGYLRFGAELSEQLQSILDRGQRLEETLAQDPHTLIDRQLAIILAGLLWATDWSADKTIQLRELYQKNKDVRKSVQQVVADSATFDDLLENLRVHADNWEVLL